MADDDALLIQEDKDQKKNGYLIRDVLITYVLGGSGSRPTRSVTPPTRGQEFGPSLVTLACILLPFPKYSLQYNLTTPYISSQTS